MPVAPRSVTYALVVLAGSAGVGLTQPTPKPKAAPPEAKKPTVMERKLKNAQGLLEGLALKDFAKIEKAADELMLCVKEATWRINDTDKYLLYSNDFIREIESVQKAAKNKNVDAATLAYMEMTMTCVKCHEHLRETRIGLAPAILPPALKAAGRE
jgi:hypothetical protein